MKNPEFYSNEETQTIGLVCTRCDPPELVASACVETLSIYDTLTVGQQQSDAWYAHMRHVHAVVNPRMKESA
jgi:hypothetical protein